MGSRAADAGAGAGCTGFSSSAHGLMGRCIGETAGLHAGMCGSHGGRVRVLAGRRIDDEGHVLVFHQVEDVGALAAGES